MLAVLLLERRQVSGGQLPLSVILHLVLDLLHGEELVVDHPFDVHRVHLLLLIVFVIIRPNDCRLPFLFFLLVFLLLLLLFLCLM